MRIDNRNIYRVMPGSKAEEILREHREAYAAMLTSHAELVQSLGTTRFTTIKRGTVIERVIYYHENPVPKTVLGGMPFDSVMKKERQFRYSYSPNRSRKEGKKLYKKFCEFNGSEKCDASLVAKRLLGADSAGMIMGNYYYQNELLDSKNGLWFVTCAKAMCEKPIEGMEKTKKSEYYALIGE